MAKKRKRKGIRYSTDTAAKCLFSSLLRDFRTSEGNTFCQGAEHALHRSAAEFREFEIPGLGNMTVGRFKRYKQIENFLKKYRFEHDIFTDDELEHSTNEAFIEDQKRLQSPQRRTMLTQRVLQRARTIARRILGELSEEEIVKNVRFGRKSSIGCPLDVAYLDFKLSDTDAFTGTSDSFRFFSEMVLPGDDVLRRMLVRFGQHLDSDHVKLNYNYLNLINVPKAWKSYRGITPLTLIGLLLSYGIGRVIAARLAAAGLDIRFLQETHRRLVRTFSLSCGHVTADLSAASNSILSDVLNAVLPRPWYKLLRKTFVRQLKIGPDQRTISNASVLPMGNGATFPVETLVFYCLIKAIGELTSTKGIYSVYGDDLIYPSSIHRYVCRIFPDLRLQLNLDKTFVSYPFRESCGADYYKGQDVRSYYLKGEAEELTPSKYQAFLYKTYNGLAARWAPEEIPQTLRWLLAELTIVSRTILRVPPSYPDYSGIRVNTHSEIPLGLQHLPYEPTHQFFEAGTRKFRFKYLNVTPQRRYVLDVEPYYWLALQGLDDEPQPYNMFHEGMRSSLSWQKLTKKRTYFRGKRRCVVKRTSFRATVASRTRPLVSVALVRSDPYFISDWI
jgi:hypothetical protein